MRAASDPGDSHELAHLREVIGQLEQQLCREQDARRRAEQSLEEAAAELWQQSEQYQMLAENASDVVYAANPDGLMTWVSPTVVTLGWTPDELIGTPTRDLVHPDDQPYTDSRRRDLYRGVIDDSRVTGHLVRVRAKDGAYHWMSNRVTLLRGPDGAPTGIVGGLTMVDELVEVQRRLRDGEEVLRLTIDAVIDPLVLLEAVRDDDGRVVDFTYRDANRAACDFLAKERDLLLGSSLLLHWPGIRESGLFNLYVVAIESGTPLVEDDFCYEDATSTRPRYFDVRARRVPEDRLALTCRDVTERHRAAARLREDAITFQLLAENSTDVVMRIGLDGVIAWASPGVRTMLGRSPQSLVGMRNFDLIRPDHREQFLADMEKVRLSGEDSRFRIPIMRADGSSLWVESAGREVIAADGETRFRVVRLRDIDAEHRYEAELLSAHQRLRSVLDGMLDPHIMLTAHRDEAGGIIDFIYVDANPVALDYLGRDRSALLGHGVRELFGRGEGPENVISWCTRARQDALALDDVSMVSAIKGEERRFDVRAVAFSDDSVSLTWRDTTARYEAARRLAESEQYFRLLAVNASDVVVRVREGVLQWVSPSLIPTLGWTPEEWIGRPVTDFVHPDDRGFVALRRGEVEGGDRRIVRLRLRHQDGSYHWIEVNAAPFTGPDGSPDGLMASFRLIDEQIRTERMLKFQARHDQLTGLLSRQEIFRRLTTTLERERRTGGRTFVAFLDLDSLKAVNDAHGHAVGDEVLRVVAARVECSLREDDLTARIGGDELLMVLRGLHGSDEAIALMATVLEQAGAEHVIGDVVVHPRMSIGLTEITPGEDVEAAVRRADEAMYRAKAAGGNQVAVADEPERGTGP